MTVITAHRSAECQALPNLERFACWQRSFFISKKNALSGKLKGFLQSRLSALLARALSHAVVQGINMEVMVSAAAESCKNTFLVQNLFEFLVSFFSFQPSSLKVFFPLPFGCVRCFTLFRWRLSPSHTSARGLGASAGLWIPPGKLICCCLSQGLKSCGKGWACGQADRGPNSHRAASTGAWGARTWGEKGRGGSHTVLSAA